MLILTTVIYGPEKEDETLKLCFIRIYILKKGNKLSVVEAQVFVGLFFNCLYMNKNSIYDTHNALFLNTINKGFLVLCYFVSVI